MSLNFLSFGDDEKQSTDIFGSSSSSSSINTTPSGTERKGNSESKKFFESFIEFKPNRVNLQSQYNLGPGLIRDLKGTSIQLKSIIFYGTTFDYHLSVDPKFGSMKQLHAATLMDMMYHRSIATKEVQEIEKIVIYDVRYMREYKFGHIRGAINGMAWDFFAQNPNDRINRKKHDDLFGEKSTSHFVLNGKTKLKRVKERIQERFGDDITDRITKNIVDDMVTKIKHLASNNSNVKPKIVFVFHCEFSSHRAPNFLKRVDAEMSKTNFAKSNVQYHIFILSQGYSFFYEYWLFLSKIGRTSSNQNYTDFVSGRVSPIQQVAMVDIFNGPYNLEHGRTDILNVNVYKELTTELNVPLLIKNRNNLAVYSSPDKKRLVIAYYNNAQMNYVALPDIKLPNKKYFKYAKDVFFWTKDYNKVDTSCFAGLGEFKKSKKPVPRFRGRGRGVLPLSLFSSSSSSGEPLKEKTSKRLLFGPNDTSKDDSEGIFSNQSTLNLSSQKRQKTNIVNLDTNDSFDTSLFSSSDSNDSSEDDFGIFSPNDSPINNNNNDNNNSSSRSSNRVRGKVLNFDNTSSSSLNSEFKKMSTNQINDFIC